MSPKVKLGSRFEDALVFAARMHADQTRKQSDVPYIAHLLGVASLVLEDGGDEDEAIAALLHDAVEDQGGLRTLEEIRTRFGEKVARIVEFCTDAYTQPKPAWRNRKESYIASIEFGDRSAWRVALADKVYNARATLKDVLREGDRAWTKFNGGKEGTLWYYRELLNQFSKVYRGELFEEFKEIVEKLMRLSGC
jgi:(p)ppGpp synthase/HD superfamily hydrolase